MSWSGGDAVTSLHNSSLSRGQNQTVECTELQTTASLVFMVFHSLLFVVGLCLNGVSLRVYFCSQAQAPPSSVTVYLRNLAAADLLISLSLPMRIAHYASNPALYGADSAHGTFNSAHSFLHWLYCSFGAATFYLNMYASILFMGHIAANRYLKIMRPLDTHFLQTRRGACLTCGATWLFLWAVAGMYVVLSLLSSHWDVPVRSLICDNSHSPELTSFYRVVHICSALIFLCVLLVLLFFYSSISRRLTLAQTRQPQSSTSTKLRRAQRNMLLLSVVFCVCFVPYHVVRLPYAFMKKEGCTRTMYLLKELSVLLSVLNVCLDPLIYLLFSQAFRSQLGLSGAFGPLTTTAHASANVNANRVRSSSEAQSRQTNKINSVI